MSTSLFELFQLFFIMMSADALVFIVFFVFLLNPVRQPKNWCNSHWHGRGWALLGCDGDDGVLRVGTDAELAAPKA